MTGLHSLKRLILRLLAVAAVGAGLAVAFGQAGARAQTLSPYDTAYTTFKAPDGVAMRSAMQDGASVVGTIPPDATGIVLRWCRPEFNFGDWQFGGARAQRQALDARWCEVSYNGKVGNVQGRMLAPK
ncbi:hypothetical protein [Methylobrevis pamukkalensis]|nr:hypothetical protein [Methylobrevis pamukkalensis]